ncbi:MAG: hypothetical protein H7306_08710, partial [Bacteriovorax sp.]|nr:hypothetical protein [Rhizobacter sp.]
SPGRPAWWIAALSTARRRALHQAGAVFVTRAKSPMDARRACSTPTDRCTGGISDQRSAISDQRAMLNGCCSARKYPEHLSHVRFKVPATGKTLNFLTTDTAWPAWPALTIAALYKSRRHVELFFTWTEQHLRTRHFLGNSETAVKTPVWCAVATDVLIAIVKKALQLDPSLRTGLPTLPVPVFEKTKPSCALQAEATARETANAANQLNRFNVQPDRGDPHAAKARVKRAR